MRELNRLLTIDTGLILVYDIENGATLDSLSTESHHGDVKSLLRSPS